MNFGTDIRATVKANSINLVVICATVNYFLLHHIATKTFSPFAFSQDNGWASIWTIVFILAGQAGTLWLLFNARTRREAIEWGILTYIYQIYCLREADLHNLAAEWHSLTNVKFYTQSAAPVELKIVAIAILSIFALGALYLLGKYSIKLFKLFLKGEPFVVSFCLWGTYLFTSQILDRASFFNDSPTPIIKNIEEMLELTAALFALLAIIQYIKHTLQTKKYSAPDS